MPGGGPVLRLFVVEIDETCGDEDVDGCSRVSVEVDDEAVGGAIWRRREKDNDSDEPV